MPVVSVFFGIVIRMFHREHGVPHFHAEYQGQRRTFTFDGRNLLTPAEEMPAPGKLSAV
ncbi:MAG: DUF4160 domain-containing protein [Acidobacteria bacterium]|nr:DUF4160 domain-containing protein [Acidobacteriota bacterium]